MLEIKKCGMVLRAEKPISQRKEVRGNRALLNTHTVRLPDGSFVDVPLVSGNAAKHALREAAAWAYLDAAGLLGQPTFEEAALRLLFSGGSKIEKDRAKKGGAIKLRDYRETVDLFPPLALFGASIQGWIPEGATYVDPMELICEENLPYFPDHVCAWVKEHGGAVSEAWDHVETAGGVALDPTNDPNKQKLLSPGARSRVEERLLARENASEMDDDVAKDEHKSTLMPFSWQQIVKGSLFYWEVRVDATSPLEIDTFMVALGCALSNLRVGGRRRAGNGSLRFVAGWNVHVQRPAESAESFGSESLSTGKVGELFRAHVLERKDRIVDFLSTVSA